ncbi:putative two-component system response regulator [Desulfatibacillum alkenivorans DSM 16219]|jgi:putative two-component system response regulator|uniref:Putative two-component system response regulator n=1 Tax=Desulfatibacillum alkenivorans DSM 16219 TaxID=1121393 RepID=A0A1M6P3A1_9BACT|nr:HD domain-containing phosphohydrolase [Desulfatibacillum alkenivorans]SHK02404.1 putative two-component system response regulator [Desulfatibacillum alkenivorans DSM 16219]
MQQSKANILLVDDEPAIHRLMQHILEREGYRLLSVYSGEEALETVAQGGIDLVILDLSMPGMDGFEVARQIKEQPQAFLIPIILFTGRDTVENHAKALEMGVDDFLSKTEHKEVILARVRLHLKLKGMHDRLADYQSNLEKKVEQQTWQLKTASLETIVKLSAASEFRDNETGAHIRRMSHYAAAIAKTMGFNKKVQESILYSAPMHDIGKIGIPDRILLKPGPLTDKEWKIMKRHPQIGASILSGAQSGFIRMAEMIALTHHEKWDGSGYPNGLKGRQIPIAGQIAAIADVFDALTSERPYKRAFSGIEAIRIIQEGRGKHFSPEVTDAFFTTLDEILVIKDKFQDTEQDKQNLYARTYQALAKDAQAPIHQTASAMPGKNGVGMQPGSSRFQENHSGPRVSLTSVG